MVSFFWDSYAVIELINGNPNYLSYKHESIILTLFNLAEVYWSSLHEYDEIKANAIYEWLKKSLVEIDDETLKEAIKFRKKNKKKNLSYTDCIGYMYALRHKLKFLTGDNAFKDVSNVEFVK